MAFPANHTHSVNELQLRSYSARKRIWKKSGSARADQSSASFYKFFIFFLFC